MDKSQTTNEWLIKKELENWRVCILFAAAFILGLATEGIFKW